MTVNLRACRAFALATATAALGACAGSAGPGTVVPLAPRELAAHALNRLAFGPRPGDVDSVLTHGVDAWILLQLSPERLPDTLADQALQLFPTLSLALPERLRRYFLPDRLRRSQQQKRDAMLALGDTVPLAPADSAQLAVASRERERLLQDVQGAKLARALVSTRQLQEVMTDFWENHFSLYAGKDEVKAYLLTFDRELIRPLALGRFDQLLRAVARSPAMLYYLDNWQSRAAPGSPVARGRPLPLPKPGEQVRGLNENYARELLELHTMGVDGGYSQRDVQEVARAFTGWTIDDPEHLGLFVFRPEWHDAARKRVLGHTLREGRGIEDGEEVLALVATHKATARYLATKLVRRFVGDSAPPALVARAAGTFRASGGDIRATLATIFASREFRSRDAWQAKVKSPFEFVASALRAADARPNAATAASQAVAQLGQPLFLHVAPNGYPERGAEWLNAGALLARINFGLALGDGRVPGAGADSAGAMLLQALGAPSAPRAATAFLAGGASPATLRFLAENDSVALAPPRRWLRFAGLAAGTPEFQRR